MRGKAEPTEVEVHHRGFLARSADDPAPPSFRISDIEQRNRPTAIAERADHLATRFIQTNEAAAAMAANDVRSARV